MRSFVLYLSLIFTILIGSHNGFIALWTDPAKEPAYVFPYSTASLPPRDREAVEKGIRVNSREELQQLIEDFLS